MIHPPLASTAFTRRFLSGSVFRGMALLVAGLLPAERAPAAEVNLLTDSSFEAPLAASPWVHNNWAKHEVEFASDRENPHSGAQSKRVTLARASGVDRPDLQLVYPKPGMRPGMSLRLSFWTRGKPNTRPVSVVVRNLNAPYKTYFQAEVALDDAWRESVFTFTLPQDYEPEKNALFFCMLEENTFWIDDVSLVELPPAAGGLPLVGNQLKNGSFEVGRDHWFAVFRESRGLANLNAADRNNLAAGLRVEERANAPHGGRVLAFEVFPECSVALTSAYFPLRYGRPATVSFRLRSSVPGSRFQLGIGQGMYPNHLLEMKGFTTPEKTPAGAWTTYSMTVTPKPSPAGRYFLEFRSVFPARYELDAVSVVEGASAPATYSPRPIDAGWMAPSDAPAGLIYHPGDSIPASLWVMEHGNKAGSLRMDLRVVDHQERERFALPGRTVFLDKTGRGKTDIFLPSDTFGGFKIEARRAGEDKSAPPLAELLYSVVPRLKPPSEARADSFFGAHARLTPYNLSLVEKLGIRWLRLHPPLTTKWMVVEREKGVFDFNTDGVALARGRGFHILGSLDTTPWFYADGDPAKTTASTWYSSFPPKDWDAWRNYVRKTVRAFGPYIEAWEVWNEPDGGFLQVKPGADRAAVYVDLVRNTREALEQDGQRTTLVGNAVATLDRPITWRQLELGGGREIDALSFHLYSEDRSPEEKRPPLQDQLETLRTFKNRSGQTPGIWHTEGGIWISGGRSWLGSAEIPALVGTTMADAAASIARTTAALKAMGVQRHFFYVANAEASGGSVYRNECSGMIDLNGVPHPAGSAHAASVFFLEDAEPAGFDVLEFDGGRATVARFLKDGRRLNVLWTRSPGVTLGRLPETAWRDAAAGFDLMGNPLPEKPSASTPLSAEPVYLLF